MYGGPCYAFLLLITAKVLLTLGYFAVFFIAIIANRFKLLFCA